MPKHGTNSLMETASRRRKVAALMLQKRPAYEIAKRLNVNENTVYKDGQAIREAWKREMLGAHDDLLAKELAALDDDEKALRDLLKGEPNTRLWLNIYDRVLRVCERRAKLLGLDAPEEIRLDVSRVQHIVAELVAIVCHEIDDRDTRQRIAEQAQGLLSRVGGLLPADVVDVKTNGNGSAKE